MRKLIYCQWLDITATESGWRTQEEAENWADEVDSIVHQTGFLISKDEDYLILACSYIPGLDLIGTTVRIPTSTIKLYKELEI